jgi:hypothetical protein
LLNKANIKITDIEGNLVYETTSEGGTIEWDTTAFGKYKVAWVYMIFISAQDGVETKVKSNDNQVIYKSELIFQSLNFSIFKLKLCKSKPKPSSFSFQEKKLDCKMFYAVSRFEIVFCSGCFSGRKSNQKSLFITILEIEAVHKTKALKISKK